MKSLPPYKKAKELYEALSLNDEASYDEIRAAWRRIASRYHPDLNNGVENEIFTKAKHAHDVLTNPNLKAHYDSFGSEKLDEEKAATAAIQQLLAQIVDKLTDPSTKILEVLLINVESNQAQSQQQLIKLEIEQKRLAKTIANVKDFWRGGEKIKATTLGLLEQKAEQNKLGRLEMEVRLSITKKALEMLSDASYVLPEIKEVEGNPIITFGYGPRSWGI